MICQFAPWFATFAETRRDDHGARHARVSASVRRESPAAGGSTPPRTQPTQLPGPDANAAAQAPSSARAGSTLGDTYDEKLGEVFKARIDELIKHSN